MNKLITHLLDFFFPRYCMTCGNRLYGKESILCIHCNIELPRTNTWTTPQRDATFRKLYGRTNIEKASAYTYYTKQSGIAPVIYAFKYKGKKHLAIEMGRRMAKEIAPSGFFDDIDYLIPVPISKQKLSLRGYNQTECLARGISDITKKEIKPNILIKTVNNNSQTTMSRFNRVYNVINNFSITDESDILRGKHCLIIDDVITTGSTVLNCINELKKIPDIKVSVLSLSTT